MNFRTKEKIINNISYPPINDPVGLGDVLYISSHGDFVLVQIYRLVGTLISCTDFNRFSDTNLSLRNIYYNFTNFTGIELNDINRIYKSGTFVKTSKTLKI